MRNDKLLPNVKKDFKEIIQIIEVEKDNTVDLEQKFLKADCIKLDISNMNKLTLEILLDVIYQKLGSLETVKNFVKPRNNWSRDYYDGEWNNESSYEGGDWKKYCEIDENIALYNEKIKEIKKKLNELNSTQETQTEKE